MGKGAPSYPQPIDPTKIINAQEGANVQTAMIQQLMNMMGTNSPFGSTSYKQTGGQTVNGQYIPTYSKNQQISPWAQGIIDQLGNINGGGGGSGPGFASPGASAGGGGPGGGSSVMQLSDPKLLEQNVSNALYNQATSRLDPQWQKTDTQTADMLANQGIVPGTAAYDHAMQDSSMAKNDAYTSAQNSATAAAEQAASQLFGEQLAGHQQGISDIQAPLGAMAQLMAGMSGQTTPQTGLSGTDVSGIYGNYQNQLNNQYQAQMQQYNGMLGGLGSLFGDVMQTMPFW
jgi:hypothetical protein